MASGEDELSLGAGTFDDDTQPGTASASLSFLDLEYGADTQVCCARAVWKASACATGLGEGSLSLLRAAGLRTSEREQECVLGGVVQVCVCFCHSRAPGSVLRAVVRPHRVCAQRGRWLGGARAVHVPRLRPSRPPASTAAAAAAAMRLASRAEFLFARLREGGAAKRNAGSHAQRRHPDPRFMQGSQYDYNDFTLPSQSQTQTQTQVRHIFTLSLWRLAQPTPRARAGPKKN